MMAQSWAIATGAASTKLNRSCRGLLTGTCVVTGVAAIPASTPM
jgi:hypothetical protein